MGKTLIEWTDETFSVQRGCDAVSPGCANCWAAATAARFSAPGEAFAGLAKRKTLPSGKTLAIWTDAPVMLLPDKLLDILSWRKPKRVFINSVSDTFHADVPFEFIAALWAFMASAPMVTFQIVTKRAKRMREFFHHTAWFGGPDHWIRRAIELCDQRIAKCKDTSDFELAHRWTKARDRLVLMSGKDLALALPNVWLLVSTENQETYDERVAELLQCPAVVRGISAEPLLGPIDLGLGRWVRLPRRVVNRARPETGEWPIAEPGIYRARAHHEGGLRVDGAVCDVRIGPGDYEFLEDIDWAIIGGESGAGCRPNDIRWTRDMLAQIASHNAAMEAVEGVLIEDGLAPEQQRTAPFLKQLGGAAVDREAGLVGALYPPAPKTDRWIQTRLKDSHGGDEAEFPADLRGYRHFPVPRLPVPPATAAQIGLGL